jgi:S1/P1 Nuclease
VARIAQDFLEDISPETLAQAIEILTDSNFQAYLHLEDKYPFVECATFADEIKEDGFNDQAAWHYVNTPLVDSPGLDTPAPVPYNITWAIEQMIQSLKHVTGRQTSHPHVNFELAESFNLRLLIHYIGDIH